MKRLLLVMLLAVSSCPLAAALDGKALVMGIGLGAGTFVTRNYVALPVAHASKKVAGKMARMMKHTVQRAATLGRK